VRDKLATVMGHGARAFRHDGGAESAGEVVSYLVNLGRPIVLRIQREVIEEGKTYSDTCCLCSRRVEREGGT
jgi:hypothetical protein